MLSGALSTVPCPGEVAGREAEPGGVEHLAYEWLNGVGADLGDTSTGEADRVGGDRRMDRDAEAVRGRRGSSGRARGPRGCPVVCGEVSMQAMYDVSWQRWPVAADRVPTPAGDVRSAGRRQPSPAACRACGAVFDVDCRVGGGPCRTAFTTHGYQIGETEVVFWDTTTVDQQASEVGHRVDEATTSCDAT